MRTGSVMNGTTALCDGEAQFFAVIRSARGERTYTHPFYGDRNAYPFDSRPCGLEAGPPTVFTGIPMPLAGNRA